MRFNHPKPISVLKNLGVVATLRTYPYIEGRRVKVKIGNETLKGTVVKVIVYPEEKDLKKYLHLSGFESVEEWLNEAIKLHKRKPKFLVIISLL